MNDFENAKIDKIIKSKMKKDNYISKQANSVFENFKNNEIRNKEDKDASLKQNTINTTKSKVVQLSFYQKLNRVLSVAAVSLTVVLVGGTALYFNKDKFHNNSDNENQSYTYTKSYLIKNEPMNISNEKVVKESENGYIKAYLVGKRDVGINLTTTYWNEFDGEFKSTDCYKVDNINKNVSDILVGSTDGVGLPYVFLLMEDQTVEYVDLKCMNNNVFYFVATPVEGLNNVASLELKTKKFSYSNTEYEYVNAVRNDGLRKEIEIGVINDWNDTVVENFDILNEKYIKAYNKEEIIDDGKGDFTVGNTTYLRVDDEKDYVYCLKYDEFYRVKVNDMSEQCIASGAGGFARDNKDGRITVFLSDKYEVYNLDKNIIFKDRNKNIINNITNNISDNPYEEENKELSEMNQEYYRCPSGDYALRRTEDLNHAYFVSAGILFRYNLLDNNYTSMASNVVDVSFDQTGLIVVQLQEGSEIHCNDNNIAYKDKDVSLANIIGEWEESYLHVYLRDDGSLNVRILEGGLEKLGYEGKTTLKENVIYNIIPAHENQSKEQFPSARANIAIIGKVGPKQRLSIVYYNANNEIVTIDVKESILKNDFGSARAAAVFDIPNCRSLEVSKADTVLNGEQLPPYDSVFANVERNGKTERIEAAWCE